MIVACWFSLIRRAAARSTSSAVIVAVCSSARCCISSISEAISDECGMASSSAALRIERGVQRGPGPRSRDEVDAQPVRLLVVAEEVVRARPEGAVGADPVEVAALEPAGDVERVLQRG